MAAVVRSVTCKHPDCEETDTKTFRIRLPGRNQDRQLELCQPHGAPLEEMAEWSDDTPLHERRPERKAAAQASVRRGRELTEKHLVDRLPLYEE